MNQWPGVGNDETDHFGLEPPSPHSTPGKVIKGKKQIFHGEIVKTKGQIKRELKKEKVVKK